MDARGIQVVIDMEGAVDIIQHVGAWMRDNRTDNYSAWWDPNQVTVNMLSKYASLMNSM